jgi:DNA invertase Pin-like site-specific DNA recombinase
MRVIGYVRVSTEEQASGGHSLDAQRAKLESYAKLYDLELIGIECDAGLSAKSLDRPGIQAALAALRDGRADGMLIAKLDRLTRSIADWQTLIDEFFGEKPAKQLASVGDQIDTRTAAGRLVLNVLLAVAQWEREIIGERTKDALRHKIKRGERCGRLRFGYDLAVDKVNLVPNAAEQMSIQTMRELRANGYSLQEICDELAGRGLPTKSGALAWLPGTVRTILQRA